MNLRIGGAVTLALKVPAPGSGCCMGYNYRGSTRKRGVVISQELLRRAWNSSSHVDVGHGGNEKHGDPVDDPAS